MSILDNQKVPTDHFLIFKFASSKGLVTGDLRLKHRDGTILNCNASNVCIPSMQDWDIILPPADRKAEFILVIEKDSSFQVGGSRCIAVIAAAVT